MKYHTTSRQYGSGCLFEGIKGVAVCHKMPSSKQKLKGPGVFYICFKSRVYYITV